MTTRSIESFFLQIKYKTFFLSKKQTKYRQVFLKIQTTIQKCQSNEYKAENRGTLSNTIAQSVYLTSLQWKITKSTQLS